jgi:hypothetical protein
MPVVWSDRCLLHEPLEEMEVGLPSVAAVSSRSCDCPVDLSVEPPV